MRAICLLMLIGAMLAGAKEKLRIRKCCGPFEMLSDDGLSCVEAPWSRNVTLNDRSGDVLPPFDARWVSRWLPPGLPLGRVGKVTLKVRHSLFARPRLRAVAATVEWDERQAEAEGAAYWRSGRVVVRHGMIRRGRLLLEGLDVVLGLRPYEESSEYCVDAAQPPLAPFALLADPNCDVDDCVTVCCPRGKVLADEGGSWQCKADARGYWSPDNSSFAVLHHPKIPFDYSDSRRYSSADSSTSCFWREAALRLAPIDEQMLRRSLHNFVFSSWTTCSDFQRRDDGSLAEALFYCQHSRIGRGVYWLLRPLCFVSTSLLGIALLSIATNSRMRRKAHGWCLACHGTCLLGFNLGQVVYYMTLSDDVDLLGYAPSHLRSACEKFALPMYYLLNAANCWLTALCFNMAFGFRWTHMVQHTK